MSKRMKQVTFAGKPVKVQSSLSTQPPCPSCRKRLVSPLLLPCLHTVCKACIDNERLRPENGKIPKCPTCSETLNIQTDFPVNFLLNKIGNHEVLERNSLIQCESCDEEPAIMHCKDCASFLCNFCATAHRRMNATKTHKMCSLDEFRSTLGSSSIRPCYCATHRTKQILYYCESCATAVCKECVSCNHIQHQLQQPTTAYPEIKTQIVALTTELQNTQKDARKTITSLQESMSKIEKHSNKIRCDIEEYFENLVTAVRKRMKTILQDLKERTESKLSKLKKQKLKLERAADNVQNCCSFTDNAVSHGSQLELISVSNAILLRLSKLRDEKITQPDVTLHQSHELLTLKQNKELLEAINNTGQLDDSPPDTDPSRSTLDVTDLHVTAKEVSRFSVTAVNAKGLRQPFGGDLITLRLCQNNEDITEFKYTVRDHGNGTYTVAILVTRPHVYSLHVNLNHPVVGSPLSVTITPKDWIGSVRMLTGGFASPHSIIIDHHGNVIIADSHHHQIKTLDSKGVLSRTIGTRGKRDMEFNFPYCIAMNVSCTLLAISDSQNNRVQLIDNMSGKLRNSIGTEMLRHPHGIAMDDDDCLYVADSGNSRLLKFSPGGVLLGKLECESMSRPWGVALTRGGLIAVTDYNNHKVLVFQRDSSLKYQFGSRGGGDGELNNPAGT